MSEVTRMRSEMFEDRLERYDDRFEITGEILLETKEGKAVLGRVLFAWTLYNKEDTSSIEDIALMLEGEPTEIAKVLRAMGKDPGDDPRTGAILLRMDKELVKDIRDWAKDEETISVPTFLMGKGRMEKVFDFDNYDLVASDGP